MLSNFTGDKNPFEMKTFKKLLMLAVVVMFSVNHAVSQEKKIANHTETAGEIYLLEREMTDASEEKLHKIAKGAQELVEEIGSQVEWVHSYVTDDKMICVFKYQTREALAEHANRAGLKISDLKKVETMIGPDTAKNR